tara:strand:+ start:6566 stop:6721 length:156 start_codon:yes stop_codon:yes gene_type:complete
MTFVSVKKGNYYYVKNTKTGKIGSNKFKSKVNADIQVKNRKRFLKAIKNKN